jgi:hypothetical protein
MSVRSVPDRTSRLCPKRAVSVSNNGRLGKEKSNVSDCALWYCTRYSLSSRLEHRPFGALITNWPQWICSVLSIFAHFGCGAYYYGTSIRTDCGRPTQGKPANEDHSRSIYQGSL